MKTSYNSRVENTKIRIEQYQIITLIFGICRVINRFDYDPISLQILQKNLVCIRFVSGLYVLVEAYFPGTTRLIIVAYNNVKSMFLAVVGRKNTELQRSYKGDILYKLYTYLIYRLNSTFFLRCKRYFQLENAAEGLEQSERQFFHR